MKIPPSNPENERVNPGPFGRAPEPANLNRWTAETELEALKNRLLRSELQSAEPGLLVALRRAANEAASLAWLEPHPLLVFPTLFGELALRAVRRHQKQGNVRTRSAAFLQEAA